MGWPQTLVELLLTITLVLGSIATSIGAVALIWKTVKAMFAQLKRAARFMDQWFGDPKADPPIPSMPQRMDSFGQQLTSAQDQLEAVKADVAVIKANQPALPLVNRVPRRGRAG